MKLSTAILASPLATISVPSLGQAKAATVECQDEIIFSQPEAANWDNAATDYGFNVAQAMKSCAIKKKLNLVSTKDVSYALQILEFKTLKSGSFEIRYGVRSWNKGAFKGEFECLIKSEKRPVVAAEEPSDSKLPTMIAEPQYETVVSDPVCTRNN